MPSRRPPASQPEPVPVRLRWPRERLATELTTQLELGEVLRQDLDSSGAGSLYDALKLRIGKWHERNRTVLEQAFTNAGMVMEYDPPVGPRAVIVSPDYRRPDPTRQELVGAMKDTLARRSHRLESIKDRLDLFEEEGPVATPKSSSDDQRGQRVFLVHGHDDGLKHEAARAIRQMTGLDPIILHEQSDSRQTIIEKFEAHASEVGAAVVLLTPDDEGRARSTTGDSELNPRARQNVVYELGWFDGRLRRGRVVALYVEGVELPSDLAGVLYIPLDANGTWKMRLGRELRSAGIEADLNNVTL